MASALAVLARAVALATILNSVPVIQAKNGGTSGEVCTETSTLGRWYPIEVASNKAFVHGRINASRPLRFVIDTGAPSGFVDDAIVESLGFKPRTSTRGNGAAGPSAVVLTRLEPPACQAAAGGVLPNEVFGALKLGEISTVEGLRVDGLVGGDFFLRHVVEIYYLHKRIRMLPVSFQYRGRGIRVPVSIEANHIYTTAVVENAIGESAEGKFMIDTGFRTAVSFTGPFAAEHRLTESAPLVRNATMGIGAGGESRATIFRLRALQLAGLRLSDVVATASLDQRRLLARSDLAGVIGGDLLRRFRVVLDYPHRQLVLERTATSDAPFDYDESGLFLVADPPDFRTARVLRILPGSPAEDAGVRERDIISSINGKAAASLGLDQVRRIFRRHDIVCRLVVQRDGTSVPITFRTRQLLKLAGPESVVAAGAGAPLAPTPPVRTPCLLQRRMPTGSAGEKYSLEEERRTSSARLRPQLGFELPMRSRAVTRHGVKLSVPTGALDVLSFAS